MATSQERADIRAKLASDALAAEYKTLRDEILQLYREQTQLAFTSALPLLGGEGSASGRRPVDDVGRNSDAAGGYLLEDPG